MGKSNIFFAADDDVEKIGGHTGICLECHFVDNLHNLEGHGGPNDCDMCHDGEAVSGNVSAASCVASACHPIDNPGECNLANFHPYSTCLKCHYKCLDGSVTTTSVPAATHTGICSACHLSYDLHINVGHHGSCDDCHTGEPIAGNVFSSSCTPCHPVDNPGTCDLTDFHNGSSCAICHSECLTDNSTTPRVTPLSMHNGVCKECHPTDDFPTDALHVSPSHLDCKICHDGAYQAGNVEANTCVVSGCHPIGNPGKCNLVELETDNHTAFPDTCLSCHYDCGKNSTTSAVPGSTAKIPAFSTHIGLCSDCHFQDDLHMNPGHTVCTLCHDISAQGENDSGPVTVSTCVPCHPVDAPDKCNLVNFHGESNCLECHFDCLPIITTTTTTSQATTTTTTTSSVPTPATTTARSICPSETVLHGDDKKLKSLRAFRNEALSGSEIGKTYIKLYYLHSPEINLILLKDKSIMTEASDVLNLLIPEIETILEEGEGTISDLTMVKLDTLLGRISKKASPLLKSDIRKAIAEIKRFHVVNGAVNF